MNSYAATSTLTRGDAGPRVSMATALGTTPSGYVEHPVFFSGFLARPDVAAAGLLSVADVAMTRYADVGRAQRVANLDPIVTASGDRLRFESFSACNGVHARFDLLSAGIDTGEIAFGTTNVDINQPLRTALASIASSDLLHLSVGEDSLTASTLDHTHVEREVTLPDRWVRGCAEVPAISELMTPAVTLHGAQISRFLGGLPSVGPPGPVHQLVKIGSTVRTVVRTAAQQLPGAVTITGTSRLRAAARIARHATALTVYAGPYDTSGWVFEVPGGRLTLILSRGPFRGFSGEGGLLHLLATPAVEQHGRTLLDQLAWTPAIDEDQLATDTGLTPDQVHAGLGWLAASGRIGYDLTEQTRFHRDLPVDATAILKRNPRLRGAQRLLDKGAVTRAPGPGSWQVAGDHDTYSVNADRVCTCPWAAKHSEGRGPCKHVLAVTLASR